MKLHRRIKEHHQEDKGQGGGQQEQHNDKSLEESLNTDMNNDEKPVIVNQGFDTSCNV